MAKINAYQVAKEANVSPSTVSRVLNHRSKVNTDTAQKVDEAIDNLKFNSIKNNKKKDLIIVNVPELTNIFYSEILEGSKASATANNFRILIDQTEISKETIEGFINFLDTSNVYGIILLNLLPTSLLNMLSKHTRVIQCCEYNIESNIPSVSVDDFEAAKKATNELIFSGKNKIAILNGPTDFKYSKERLRGFKSSLKEHNILFNPKWCISLPSISYDIAYPIVSQMLNSSDRPNAFFCVSDTLGAAVISAARKFKLKIPEDVSIIGFDNTIISKIISPSLTTINQPKFQEGYSAVELLRSSNHKRNHLFLKTELIGRETT
ncbi:LacI family DNA-binding transcriptional regulator [Companilactobacillus halodurans]|uniref:LacI family transcriptional regulator n=1 Tax=Companilactobacillus halodurans TaxID=2584183 RepID=A0A5P0ZYD2_9LACO|nr:LacI family DNA-binding transcriptional regulator [Companilactobacillus halodurans]MQS75137.1 LacI family transcriptional regulator [Companilactobacillus halodurans]MQS97744.1 LacI family transcriptional regulator [Companilactobacillus halodurans]